MIFYSYELLVYKLVIRRSLQSLLFVSSVIGLFEIGGGVRCCLFFCLDALPLWKTIAPERLDFVYAEWEFYLHVLEIVVAVVVLVQTLF